MFELLSRLEKKMSHVIKSVGNIEHEVYPSILEHSDMFNKEGHNIINKQKRKLKRMLSPIIIGTHASFNGFATR